MYTYFEYKGHYISFDLYGNNEYTVQYCGDDIYFRTEKDAKEFIDSIS